MSLLIYAQSISLFRFDADCEPSAVVYILAHDYSYTVYGMHSIKYYTKPTYIAVGNKVEKVGQLGYSA